MSLIKIVAIGAVVAYGISYITKKRTEDGKSILDDITEKAPGWLEQAKQFGEDTISQVTHRVPGT
jgi:hypothetical protein